MSTLRKFESVMTETLLSDPSC